MIIHKGEFVVECNNDSQTRDDVFERLLNFFIEHKLFSGECIGQSDVAAIEGPELLAEIADKLLKFRVKD